jgi:hypothetical protein
MKVKVEVSVSSLANSTVLPRPPMILIPLAGIHLSVLQLHLNNKVAKN